MAYQLHPEPMDHLRKYTLEDTGIYKKSIEDRIVEELGEWALRKHDSDKLPLSLSEAKERGVEVDKHVYSSAKGRRYLPWELYSYVRMGRQIFSHGPQGELAQEIEAVNEVFKADIKVACHFMNGVYMGLKKDIFKIFIPDYNKAGYDNPDEKSFKDCLEYVKERASTKEKFETLGISYKSVVEAMLKGIEEGEMCLKTLINARIEHVFFPAK